MMYFNAFAMSTMTQCTTGCYASSKFHLRTYFQSGPMRYSAISVVIYSTVSQACHESSERCTTLQLPAESRVKQPTVDTKLT